MRITICCLCLLLCFSCKQHAETPAKVEKENAQPSVTDGDTIIISRASAIYCMPDSAQLEAWKKKAGDENFFIAADDRAYYTQLSQEYLVKKQLPVLAVTGKRMLKFIKKDGTIHLILTGSAAPYVPLYFFSPEKDPLPADMVNIEKSYADYFNKK
ncbi:MAG: hypothetical protein NTW29_08540 [Bacteroidetes bacterium]|nr:hypothetical protein [Bacteroidota bacterium]